ncbi:MAG TPA: 4Fe-4S binding protein [Dehalococcoidia bacterium]|nr:4Fe-4S binding protein [Dehalococcoidia bacterium]
MLEVLSAVGVFPVDGQRCVRAWHRRASCQKCVESCPQDAISLEDGISVDQGRCTQCGKCVPACPTGALGGMEGIPLHPAGSLTLTCGHQLVEEPSWALPGMHAVDELVAGCLAAAGTKELILSGCSRCGLSGAALAEKADALSRFLREHGFDVVVRPVEQKEVSRRALLQGLGSQAAAHAKKLARPLRRRLHGRRPELPVRRQLLLKAIANGAPFTVSLGSLTAGERCDCCMLCARFCPTGALQEKQGETLALELDTSKCVDCDLCIELCPKDALSHDAQQGGMLTLREISLRPCRDCGRPSADERCPQCGKSRRLVMRG